MIGGWMVASGQLDPDFVQSWTRQQIAVSEVGVAGRSVVNEWARTTWTVEFERSGNDIRNTNPELIMAPDVDDMRCDPGVVVQK